MRPTKNEAVPMCRQVEVSLLRVASNCAMLHLQMIPSLFQLGAIRDRFKHASFFCSSALSSNVGFLDLDHQIGFRRVQRAKAGEVNLSAYSFLCDMPSAKGIARS
jgi:hypothetical protein